MVVELDPVAYHAHRVLLGFKAVPMDALLLQGAEFLADAEATADPDYIEHAHQVAAHARTMHGLEG